MGGAGRGLNSRLANCAIVDCGIIHCDTTSKVLVTFV